MKTVSIALLALGLLAGCTTTKEVTGRAQVTDQSVLTALPTTVPSMVYVSDFDLDAADMQSDQPLLPGPGIVQRPLHRLRGEPDDPVAYAQKLVDVMSTTLVTDLDNAGVPARRLAAGEPPPSDGWLVRGVFTDVEEGNRLKRAIIGFGAGATKMQLNVVVSDLSSNATQPFYTFDTSKGSGKMPGAIITLNPYVAAAKFVLSRNGLEKDTRKTAAKIADEIATQVRQLKQNGKSPES
ncbi:MAG TPA: DUF4410 domain-containing protein [Verrucomicrobiae bacterium]|nr:DUF4410 domain-containing protein [Verrucomicrobiae bacterium]